MPVLRRLLGSPDLALDLGTANTRMFAQGCGLIAEEPSVVKVSVRTTGGEEVGVHVLPLQGGVVVNPDAAAALLQPIVARVRRFGRLKPRALVCIPTDASERERKALLTAARSAGVGDVTLVPEPLAAAVGAGMDIASAHSQMIVDIGDGVTDIAVIRADALVHTLAVRKACSDLHRAVRNSIRHDYHILLRREDAEFLTRQCGVLDSGKSIVVSGTHCETNRETQAHAETRDLVLAQEPVLQAIGGAIASFVKRLPPHTRAEVVESGVLLTGGGACLPGMPELLASRTSLNIRVVHDPLYSVIDGARSMLASV